MSLLRIAPYLAHDVQRSYLRQQRVGERIAEVKESSKAKPATEVDISSEAQAASDLARKDAGAARQVQIDLLAEEFVNRFLFNPGGEAEDESEASAAAREGRTAFVRLLESYGLTIQRDGAGFDEAIVNKETGEAVVPFSPETHQAARNDLLSLTREILGNVL